MDLNNKTLLQQLKDKLGWSIDSVTLWTWVRKGYIKPSSYMHNGRRIVPIYYQRDFNMVVATLHHLQKLGSIRIKGYDKNKSKTKRTSTG